MHAKSTVAAALLAAAPLVSAGSAIVNNQCNFKVYLTSVSDTAPSMATIRSGHSWSEAYKTNPNGGGVSIKIATSPDTYGSITQLEYTIDSTLWYDMSNINGNPFMQWGMTLVPSSSGCRNVLCKAGVEECADAYNTPWQNEATAACGTDSDLVLTLCSGQDNEQTPVKTAKHAIHNALHGALNVDVGGDHKKHHHKHHNNSDHKKHHGKHHKNKAPAPAPAPAPVPAPVPAGVQVATTMVTQVVTVTARDAKPSAHPHAEYHRHHFHRHS